MMNQTRAMAGINRCLGQLEHKSEKVRAEGATQLADYASALSDNDLVVLSAKKSAIEALRRHIGMSELSTSVRVAARNALGVLGVVSGDTGAAKVTESDSSRLDDTRLTNTVGDAVTTYDRPGDVAGKQEKLEERGQIADTGFVSEATPPASKAKTDRGPPIPQETQEFISHLFDGLPEDKEERLIGLIAGLDQIRTTIRGKLQVEICKYVQERNPAKLPERKRSVDIINGLMKRCGFALEHPDHPGQKCYLYLAVDSGNRQGQIRLIPEGSSTKPLDWSARLSNFEYVHVVDATTPIEPAAPSSSPWSSRLNRTQTKEPPTSRG